MKQRPKRRVLKILVVMLITSVVGYTLMYMILSGYFYSWTGFGEYYSPTGEFTRAKTLWDWMELLIIPSILAVGLYYLNYSERAADRQLAQKRTNEERQLADNRTKLERSVSIDRQREIALQAYIDQISGLLLNENLRTTHSKEVRNVARTRTLTVLRLLDPSRKGFVVKFIYEAGLINIEHPVIDLVDADLTFVNLANSMLESINLKGAIILRANIKHSNLNCANLSEAQLNGSDMSFAHLMDANLMRAHLIGTNLRSASLYRVDMSFANLTNADLSFSDLGNAELRGAIFEKTVLKHTRLEYASLNYKQLKHAYIENVILPDSTVQK